MSRTLPQEPLAGERLAILALRRRHRQLCFLSLYRHGASGKLLIVFVTVYHTPSPRGKRVTRTRCAALSGSAGAARASSHALVYLLVHPTHQCRYRGLSKTRLQHPATAAVININRLAALTCSLIMRPVDILGFACVDRRYDDRRNR